MGKQLSLNLDLSPVCPFRDFLDEDDCHCLGLGAQSGGYDFLDENDKRLGQWLADVRGVGLNNVIAQPSRLPGLPIYIPGITRGSYNVMREIYKKRSIPIVAVTLGSILNMSKDKISVLPNVRESLGLEEGTKLVLLCYGRDYLIERIWPVRHEIYRQIKKSGFDLVTGINYSIWLDQPHAERLINLKRNLITFSEMQDYGLTAIPHIYWYGQRDIERISEWINQNPINMIALNLQTLGGEAIWKKNLTELRTFYQKLSKPVHFLITGPTTLDRIEDLKLVLPSLSLTNSALLKAVKHETPIRISEKACRMVKTKEDPAVTFLEITDFYTVVLLEKEIKGAGYMRVALKSSSRLNKTLLSGKVGQ